MGYIHGGIASFVAEKAVILRLSRAVCRKNKIFGGELFAKYSVYDIAFTIADKGNGAIFAAVFAVIERRICFYSTAVVSYGAGLVGIERLVVAEARIEHLVRL